MAVDVASGTVSLTFKDITIPGKFPLIWSRRYASDLLEAPASPLGPGWTNTFYAKLTRQGKDWHFITSDGGLVVFPDPKDELEDGKVLRNPGSYHEISKAGFYLKVTHWNVDSHEVTRFIFQPARNGRLWPLKSLENGTGQGLDLAWDDRGLLKGVRQKLEKRTLAVHHTSEGRLASVAFLFADGSQQTLIKYQYDAKGMLAAATNALEQTDRYEYREDGRISRETARDGAVFNFKYDDSGRCIRTWGLENYDLKIIRYFDNSNCTEVVDSYGAKRWYHRLASGQVDVEINPLGGISKTEYDEFGRITKFIDPLEAETTFFYDENGNRSKTIDPLGNESTYKFDSHHHAVCYVDANGNEWKKRLDEKGQLRSVTDPGGGLWEYDYDESGNLVEVRNPLGPKTRLRFQPNGDLAEVEDWDGLITRYRCDAFGRIVRFETPAGTVTTRVFDALGRMTALEETPKEKYTFQYNAKGKLTRSTDANGKIFARVYGTCGRLIERIDADGKRVKYIWGSEPSRLLKFINARGEAYEFAYDAAGKKIKEKAFDGRETIFKRDIAGNCIETGNIPENTMILACDKMGRLISKIFPDGTSATFAYDSLGLVLSAENSDCKLEFKRDPMGRVVEEIQGDRTIRYQYDVTGNLLAVKADQGFEVSYAYGETGTLAQVVHNGKNKIEFRKGSADDPVYRILPGGGSLSHRFDRNAGSMVQKVEAGGKPVLQREYRFNADGRIDSVQDSRRGRVQYSYGPSGRIANAVYEGAGRDGFDYDEAGRLLRMELAGRKSISFGYLQGDRLESKGPTGFEYDMAGRLKSIVDGDPSGPPGKWCFAWDAMDQLRTVIKPDGETWTYAYDALGRRISKQGPEGTTQFLWDRHVVVENKDPDGNASTWAFGPSGFIPLGKETNGRFYSVITDHLGTPKELLDETGEISWSVSHQIFGEIKTQEGEGPDCEIRFPGQWFDAETGFHYNRFRYYDPSTGRYISQDPIGLRGGINPYSYCVDPLNWMDPYGLATLFRGMKKDENGQPVVYSGEGGNGQNAADSLGVRPIDKGKMSTNSDPANIQEHRKPAEFGGSKPNESTAMFAIDSDVLAQHGLVHVPDGKKPGDTHVSITVAEGVDPSTLPERLAATKEHWKPISKEEFEAQKKAEEQAKKEGGCSG